MDTNGNKYNPGVREGNVLGEAWDVYVDPLWYPEGHTVLLNCSVHSV